MRWIHTISLALFLCSTPVAEAAEGKRVAFVVGIGTYDNLPADKQLKNPINDAEGVSAKLAVIGFQVTKAPNLTRSAFNEKWQNILDTFTSDDTFVLFFSGHGVQIDGQNYLLPRDIPYIEYGRQSQLTREAISLSELLADLSTSNRPHPRISVVIVDACRDNPLIPPGYKSITPRRGLANTPESDGIFVIHSASSNRIALDRLSPADPSKYSVFTRALLPLIGRKDLTIQELSVTLRDSVAQLTKAVGYEQRPAYFDGIAGKFCLPGCSAKTKQDLVSTNDSSISSSLTKQSAVNAVLNSPAMVLIPAGEFSMGPSDGASFRTVDGKIIKEPPPLVRLSNSFFLARFETTIEEYNRFAESTGRNLDWTALADLNSGQGRKPITHVSWDDAKSYANWLSQQTGKRYRLPSEAEWEYAARSGGKDNIWAGTSSVEMLEKYAVYNKNWKEFPYENLKPNEMGVLRAEDWMVLHLHNSRMEKIQSENGAYQVGGRKPNSYGLYDMSGNVREWVEDCNLYHNWASPDGSARQLDEDGKVCKERVVRGGAFNDGKERIGVTSRSNHTHDVRMDNLGFRLAQDID